MINQKSSKIFAFLFFLSLINFLVVSLFSHDLLITTALGKHTISLFIQLPFLTFVYLILQNYFKLNYSKSLLLTLVSIIPSIFILSKYFFIELSFFEEDNLRYDRLAKYYLENKTLIANSAFSIQPGYSYYLSIVLLFFDEQNRFTQLFNIIVCFVFISIFLNFLKNYKLERFEKHFIYYLILSSTLFLSKNVIFSISEWLYISIIFCFPILLIKKKYRTITILLGFAVLIRTNYVFAITLFSLIIFFFKRNRLNVLIYFLIILIPFFHNLIFHDEYALFVTSEHVNIALHSSIFDNINSFTIYSLNHFLSYFVLSKSYLSNEWFNSSFIIAVVSLPFFSFYFIFKFFKIDLKNKITLIVLGLVTIGMTYLFGWAYYPRFQITNYLTIFVLLICVNILRDRYDYN